MSHVDSDHRIQFLNFADGTRGTPATLLLVLRLVTIRDVMV
jgi:hypothetical protein